jgi:hypothetical protein
MTKHIPNLITATCPSELDGLKPRSSIRALAAANIALYETARDQSNFSFAIKVLAVSISRLDLLIDLSAKA